MLQSIEEVGYERGFEQGLEQIQQTLEKIAENLLKIGKLTEKEIAGATGIKLSEVRELAKALNRT